MNIYNVIEQWDLDSPKLDFKKFSRGTISSIANDVQNCYTNDLPPSTGRFHQSLATATQIVENIRPAEDLALPLIFAKQILLPDPLYSALTVKANSTWHRLPESGNRSFSPHPPISSHWKTYWSTPIASRIEYLNKTIPPLVNQLNKLRPLVESGSIVLQPWEIAVEGQIESLRRSVSELRARVDVIKEITQRYTQGNYHLGSRIGALAIEVSEDNSAQGLKKGAPMWIGDKTEILMMGLIHCLVSSRYSSNFLDTLPGDRVVHDYIRSDGILRPVQQEVIKAIKIPNLGGALWPDIIAIKRDSELLSKLQDEISKLAYCNEDDQFTLIKEVIAELEANIVANASLMKYVKLPFSALTVSAVAGTASNLVTGANVRASVLAATLSGAAEFVRSLVCDYCSKGNRAMRERRELIIRISSRLK